jgi:NDP-sugar pyrophosphorylase family protein
MVSGKKVSVRGIILAGVHRGVETSFDRALPRPLVPVANSPLICCVLGWLRDAGIPQATICANSASRLIRRTLYDGSAMGMDLDYYEDWVPRGPAGSIRDAGLNAPEELFVVADASVVPRVDLHRLIQEHLDSKAAVTVVVRSDTRPSDGGNEDLIPTGIFVFQRSVLEHVPAAGYQDIKEVLIPELYRIGEHVRPHLAQEDCPRVSDASSYLAVNEWVMNQMMNQPSSLLEYRQVDQSWVHESAVVDPEAKLIDHVLVGPETRIEKNATIVGPTSVGAGCHIQDHAVVSRSVVWDRCHIGRNSIVDRSILTHGAGVGSRAWFTNVVHSSVRPASRVNRSPAKVQSGQAGIRDRKHQSPQRTDAQSASVLRG